MSALIYVETSIPSFYYETRPETGHQARREWWGLAKVRDTLLTSLAVIEELERAPEPKRTDGIALLDALPLLESPPEVDEIVAAYLAHKLMPRDAAGDAQHLALSLLFTAAIFWRRGTVGTSPMSIRSLTSGGSTRRWATPRPHLSLRSNCSKLEA